MRIQTSALALFVLAGAAYAQPATYTDLGTHTITQAFTQPVTLVAANDIQWFRIELPAVAAVAGYVDVWTTPTADPIPATDLTDTEIGLYDNLGNAASTGYNDDDDGPSLWSALSYGSTSSRGVTTFPTLTNGADRNGRDGPLAGGVYWLAVGRFNVTFAPAAWSAVGAYTGPQTTTLLNFDIQTAVDPFPPTGTGNADSATGNGTVLLTVTVTPGGNPTSTGLAVTGDLSSVGGSATTAFNDSGTGGDATAGDNIFSYTLTYPASTSDEAAISIPFTVTDAQSRSDTGTIDFTADVNQSLATATVPAGSGSLATLDGTLTDNDVDIYKISICDAATFSATTYQGTTADTRLYLFRPDGTGVTGNDDVPTGQPGDTTLQSLITNANVTANGDYYLAVTRYDVQARDAADDLIWAETPFDTERAPDGPGAANPLHHWAGDAVTTANVTYTIALTGACFPGGGGACGPADLGGTGGVQGADGHLDNNDFVVFIDLFFNHSPLADQGSTGGTPGADGVWDNNDFVVFIDNFFNAPASCR